MGKIIRNGIKYSGTTNSADKINYNNTLSGLEAETAQEAFDELNTKIKNGGNIEYLTQEEYDALPDTKLSNDVEYRITNANESINAARDWAYDNAASGLEAENVQDAIDEVNNSLATTRYICRGKLLSSTSGTSEGYGVATINISNGIATIIFSLKVEVAGTVNGTNDTGVFLDNLASCCFTGTLPTITPASGGTITYYSADGNLVKLLNGYSGTPMARATEKLWLLGRMYDTSGSVGAWQDSAYTKDLFVTGTLYGVVS